MYYQVTEYFDPIGGKKIPSKCPDCGQQDCLELYFYQKRIETPFSKNITKKVSGILYCHNTKTEIPPVQWSDEIENYFNIEKEKLQLNPTGLKFNKWFYAILIIPIVVILFSILYFQWEHREYTDQSASIEQVAKGDKVAVMLTMVSKTQNSTSGNTWFLVNRIDGDTIILQRHKDFSEMDSSDFDLEDSNFTGETIKAVLPRFKERFLTEFDYTKMKFTGYITEIEK